MTGFRNFAVFHRRKDGAALLLDMRAAGEFTLPDVRLELRKCVLQILGRTKSICSVSNEEKPGVSAM